MHKYLLTWQNQFTTEDPSSTKWAADKKRRTKTPIKRQFMVRLIEKSLLVNTEPDVVATTMTSTQTSVVKPTTTAAVPSRIPLTVYNLAQTKVQEIPNPTRKFQEEESPFTPNCRNTSYDAATAQGCNCCHIHHPTDLWWHSMATHCPMASTNLFVARAAWPILPNVN